MAIPANDYVLFDCGFVPNLPDMLFTKKLTAQILWNYELPDKKEDDFLTVPIQMSLRIIGNIQ